MTHAERYRAKLEAMTNCYDALMARLAIQRDMIELLSTKRLLAPGYPGATVDDSVDDLEFLMSRLLRLSTAMADVIAYGEAKELLYSRHKHKPDLKIVKAD